MRQRPSTTALAVTVGLLFDAYDPDIEPLLPPGMRDLAAACVSEFPPRGTRILRFLERRWYRALMRRGERVTAPGIFLHYLMRKLFIEDAVRGVLTPAGATRRQVVVVGAGLDTLGARLALAEDARGWHVLEVDHPLTQSVKRRALSPRGLPRGNFTFVELDLTRGGLEDALTASPSFDASARTVFVAEGLLMYLTPEQVSAFFAALHRVASPGSRVVFTFMESDRPDRIRFKSLTRWYAPLLDLWLRRLGEPMHWAIDRTKLERYLEPLGWGLQAIADRDTFRRYYLEPRGLGGRALADGEYVGVAERR